MSQNIIAPKIKHRVRLFVTSIGRGGGYTYYPPTSSSSCLSPPALVDDREVRKKLYEKKSNEKSELLRRLEKEKQDIDVLFEAHYEMAMERKKELDDAEKIRQQHLLFQKMTTEIPAYHRYSLLSYEIILVRSFLRSYIYKMSPEIRKNVIKRVRAFEVDPTVFDLNSFQKLLYQTNYVLSFLDVYNEEESYYGVFRLFKKNLYRFWNHVGMTHLYNLDYHWEMILKDFCQEYDERLVDIAQKQLEEGIQKLAEKKKKVEHTCRFLNTPSVSDTCLEEIMKQNQKMRDGLRESYLFYLNSPDTVVV